MRTWSSSADARNDHGTKKVRGILCHKCNLGLGMFFDNPDFIRAALFYLEGDALA